MNERQCVRVSKFALSATTDWGGGNHFHFFIINFSQDGITHNNTQVLQVTAAVQK